MVIRTTRFRCNEGGSMILTIKYLNRYFDIYNVKYFNSILPVPKFELMNTKYLLGQYCPPSTGSHKIRITKAYEGAEVFFQNTLIHEMIHYYLNFIGDEDKGWARSHGPNFKREASRINKDGWNIQRCATQDEMSMVKLVKEEKVPKPSLHANVLSVIDNPFDENQLVNFVLKSRSKEKETILCLVILKYKRWYIPNSMKTIVLLKYKKEDVKQSLKPTKSCWISIVVIIIIFMYYTMI